MAGPRYYVILDSDFPLPESPSALIRCPERGGPPYEVYDAPDDRWTELPALVAYFANGEMGAQEVPSEQVSTITDNLKAAQAA